MLHDYRSYLFGQMYVMKYLYIDKEKENVQKQLQRYYTFYEAHKQDENTLQRKELLYANQQGIMIARLDKEANIKKLPSGDYYIKTVDKMIRVDPLRLCLII